MFVPQAEPVASDPSLRLPRLDRASGAGARYSMLT
jgi:hypothetical protein